MPIAIEEKNKRVQQFIKSLIGMTYDPYSLNDDQFQESQHIENMEKDDIKIILCRHYLIKMRLLYIMDEYDEALIAANKCAALKHYHMGTIIIPEYFFYHCLILSALYPSVSKPRQILWFFDKSHIRDRPRFVRNKIPLFRRSTQLLNGRNYD